VTWPRFPLELDPCPRPIEYTALMPAAQVRHMEPAWTGWPCFLATGDSAVENSLTESHSKELRLRRTKKQRSAAAERKLTLASQGPHSCCDWLGNSRGSSVRFGNTISGLARGSLTPPHL
jgi:hypothetical protein